MRVFGFDRLDQNFVALSRIGVVSAGPQAGGKALDGLVMPGIDQDPVGLDFPLQERSRSDFDRMQFTWILGAAVLVKLLSTAEMDGNVLDHRSAQGDV